MLGEHSQTADNGWRERCRRARLEFLITELQTGHVFASLAITSTNPANVTRYRHLAREAYDTVMRFWPTLPLHIDEHKRLGVGLASLESKIEELAHPRREVSNSDGITADETNAPAFRLAFRP